MVNLLSYGYCERVFIDKRKLRAFDVLIQRFILSSSYRSLRRTTAEIQNYGFERLERATTSKDSGISNMADVEERIEGLTLSNSVSREKTITIMTLRLLKLKINDIEGKN